MKSKNYLKSGLPLGKVTKNIGTMFLNNRDKFANKPAFAQKEQEKYRYWTWEELVDDISKFSVYLKSKGLKKGDRIAVISRNYYQRLVVEMAVLASGFVSVPIFFRYTEEMMTELLNFSDVKMLILVNYWRLEYLPVANKHLVVMETPAFPRKLYSFEDKVEFQEPTRILYRNRSKLRICHYIGKISSAESFITIPRAGVYRKHKLEFDDPFVCRNTSEFEVLEFRYI